VRATISSQYGGGGGTKRGIARIKSLMINYLVSVGMQRARAKVGWTQYCQDRANGRINLVNLEDAVVALMSKWIVKALEPGMSNLHIMLRYRLGNYQPYQWAKNLEFFMVIGHQSHNGSLGWNMTTSAWKLMLRDLQYVPPNNIDDLSSCSLWYCPEAPLIGPWFSKQRASTLYKEGMRHYRDVMEGTKFISSAAAQKKFGLKRKELGAWNTTTNFLCWKWGYILNTPQGKAARGDWLGIYPNMLANQPYMIVQAKEGFESSNI
jgi:hypothetical protein